MADSESGIVSVKAQMPKPKPKRGFENLPWEVVEEILVRLDLESLCSVAPACKLLRPSVYRVLGKLHTINLSELSVDEEVLHYLFSKNKSVQNLTINCIRLNDFSFENFRFSLSSLQELVLQKCLDFTPKFLVTLGNYCFNLRLLSLELIYHKEFETCEGYKFSLKKLFEGCPLLESLSIKFEGPEFDPHIFDAIDVFIPTMIKCLHIQHVTEHWGKQLAQTLGVQRIAATSTEGSIPFSIGVSFQTIQSLSLVVDKIADELLISITQNLSLLVKLDLHDEPLEENLLRHDLTNRGLQSLASCNHLCHLSLVRRRGNKTFFRRVNDMDMFLMAEVCKNMESIKLGGFKKVTDAGFSALLHTCKNLKTFELYRTFHLSDLAFHDLLDTSLSLVSVRLTSCPLITSDSVQHLALCENLELLDLSFCRSVADDGMRAISKLKKLNTLYLNSADITDIGLSILGGGEMPLESLSLRNCRRVGDHGIALLLGGCIKNTLKALDLGYMPAISDEAIKTVAEVAVEIVDLCIRFCFFVTDASFAVLASRCYHGMARGPLRRLDLYNCTGLSTSSLQWLNKPYFPHLRWLGLGSTPLSTVCNPRELDRVIQERPSLSLCWDGCEVGCHNKWQFHYKV